MSIFSSNNDNQIKIFGNKNQDIYLTIHYCVSRKLFLHDKIVCYILCPKFIHLHGHFGIYVDYELKGNTYQL